MSLLPFGSAPTPDASATKKGKIKLANNIGGTADIPTITVTNSTSTSITVPDSQTMIYAGRILLNGGARIYLNGSARIAGV